MRLAFVLLTIAFGWLQSSGTALSFDEIPEGFVERTVGVVIRDRTATVRYAVGAHPHTICQILQDWESAGQISPDQTDEEVIECFRQATLETLPKQMELSIGGQPVELRPKKCELSSRHHFTVIAHYEFELTGRPEAPVTLSMTDENFAKLDGAVRTACKALGKAMLLKSKVAPIIVRAKRHELNKLNQSERIECCRIEAIIGFYSNE